MTVNDPSDQMDELPCAAKLAFDTEKQARGEAIASEYRHGGKLKVYKCRHCGLYHLATDYNGQ